VRFYFPPFENITSSSVYAHYDCVVHEWHKERACSLFFPPLPKFTCSSVSVQCDCVVHEWRTEHTCHYDDDFCFFPF